MTEEQRQRLIELESIDRVEWCRTATWEVMKEREYLMNLRDEEEIAQQKMEFVREKFMVDVDDSKQYYFASVEGASNKDEAYRIALALLEEFVTQFYSEEEDDL